METRCNETTIHHISYWAVSRYVESRLTEILERALLLVLLGRFAVHEVVESNAVLEEVVKTTHDAEDTEGEDPDTDNGHDGSLTADEPAEEAEEGGDDIDNQDSSRQLPRRNG